MYYQIAVNTINKNLLKLTYSSDLSEMFFEYISYFKNKKASNITRNSNQTFNFGLGT